MFSSDKILLLFEADKKLSWLLQPQIFNLAINFLINFFFTKKYVLHPLIKKPCGSFILSLPFFKWCVCAVQLPFCENSFGCIKWRIKNIFSQNVKLSKEIKFPWSSARSNTYRDLVTIFFRVLFFRITWVFLNFQVFQLELIFCFIFKFWKRVGRLPALPANSKLQNF